MTQLSISHLMADKKIVLGNTIATRKSCDLRALHIRIVPSASLKANAEQLLHH